MPLDNTAKLSDIIGALEDMQAINAKADLASVVGAPANSNDTMATINSVIQGAKNTLAAKMNDGSSGTEPLQGLVEKLVMGKKWASGSGYVNSAATTITGLSFKPSIIVLYAGTAKGNVGWYTGDKTTWRNSYRLADELVIPKAPVVSGESYNFEVSTTSTNTVTGFDWLAVE